MISLIIIKGNNVDITSNLNSVFSSNNYPESTILEFIVPYVHDLSLSLKEQKNEIDIDDYNYNYFASFIKKADINMGFISTDGFVRVISSSLSNWIDEKIKKHFKVVSKNVTEIFQKVSPVLMNAVEKNLNGIAVKHSEVEIKLPKNNNLYITWESFPWFKKDGKVAGVIFFLKDITQRKEALSAVNKLTSRLELLEKFSFIFSHDLMQPLRQVSLYSSFIEEDLKDKIIPSKHVQSLKRCVKNALDMYEGILACCKNGNLTSNREKVNISEIIGLLTEWCENRPEIIIKNSIPSGLALDINRAYALQLFQNLLDNSIKHSDNEDGQIIITLSGRYLKENNFYEFTLHNNGWTNPQEKRKNIYNAHYSKKKNGSGMGLLICKKIVDAYEGEINLISSPQKGTNVVFTLPIVPKVYKKKRRMNFWSESISEIYT